MRIVLFAALVAAVLAPLAAPAQVPTHAVHVVRHFDTPKGERDPDLLPAGQARAGALVRWFAGKPLAAIFVTDYRRTRQTAAPLAAARGIAVQTYDPADNPALVARIRASGGPVLVVGHSNTVPDIVAALGGTRPRDLVHEVFGDIWTVDAAGTVTGRVGE